jgi:hypothetical protein
VVPVPAPKPWRRPPPEPIPVDLDDEAAALDLIDRIRGLRLNGAENFEVWLQQRADAEYAASLLIAHGGLTDDTRIELERETTLLRRQANPPTSGARVWTRSDERISSASEVDDPRLAEARAYDLVDRMRSLRLNGTASGHDLHRERSYLLAQSELLLTTASLQTATRRSLGTETDLLRDLSDEIAASTEPVATAAPEPKPEPAPVHDVPAPLEAGIEAEPDEALEPHEAQAVTDTEPAESGPRLGFWRRLSRRVFGSKSADPQ